MARSHYLSVVAVPGHPRTINRSCAEINTQLDNSSGRCSLHRVSIQSSASYKVETTFPFVATHDGLGREQKGRKEGAQRESLPQERRDVRGAALHS